MNYPIVYDKFTTDFNNFGLAILDNSYELRVFQRLNGEYLCTFNVPRDGDKTDYLVEENIVKVNGQLFIIRRVEEDHNEDNTLPVIVECEHISSELAGEPLDNVSLTSVSAQTILDNILSGTRFTGSAISLAGTYDFTAAQKNATWGITQLIKSTDSELNRDNFNITLEAQIGSDNGVQFRYQKNIRSIKRTVDSTKVITRLYVYGKDGLTLESVNGGLKYIDSANISLYARPKIGYLTISDETDTTALLSKAQTYLATVDTPLVTYDVQVIELKAIADYGDSEGFIVGDTVHVYDEILGLTLTARIVEYEEYPLEPIRSRCTLANFLPVLEDSLVELQQTQLTVDAFTTAQGKIKTFWLDGVINALVNQLKASGSYANAQVIEGQGTLFENTNSDSPDFGALYIGPGIFALANAKNGDGSWAWRTFGTGKGFTADEINAGQIQTSLVKIFGDANFYWDDRYILIQNPSNAQQQIRIGLYDGTNYGIAFTTDGGITWKNTFDFNGLVIGPDTNFASGYDPTTKATPADVATVQTAADNAQNTANNAQTAANNAATAASNAQTAANNAQSSANTANAELSDIASDNKLTPVEKQATTKEFNIIVSEKPTIDLQADVYSISTEKTNYDNAYNTLYTYITPLLSDITTTSDIVGTDFRNNFKSYYDARTALLKKISDTAKSLADSAQSTANSASSAASTAQSTANTAQNTANSAQSTANNSVQQGTLYNQVRVTETGGIEVIDSNGVQRVHIGDLGGGKYGVQIIKADSTISFDVDSNGEIDLTKGQINITHSNGSKTIVDGASCRFYPSASDSTNYIAVDGNGMFRNFNGTITRFVEANVMGSATIPGEYGNTFYAGPDYGPPSINSYFDLIGPQWVGKSGSASVMLTVTGYDGPYDTNYSSNVYTKVDLVSVTAITGGIRVNVQGGCLWTSAANQGYTSTLNYRYVVIA